MNSMYTNQTANGSFASPYQSGTVGQYQDFSDINSGTAGYAPDGGAQDLSGTLSALGTPWVRPEFGGMQQGAQGMSPQQFNQAWGQFNQSGAPQGMSMREWRQGGSHMQPNATPWMRPQFGQRPQVGTGGVGGYTGPRDDRGGHFPVDPGPALLGGTSGGSMMSNSYKPEGTAPLPPGGSGVSQPPPRFNQRMF